MTKPKSPLPTQVQNLPLSCFIITCNEADRLARTLQSVCELADELVVVDSGSTDETVTIAKSFGAKVLHNAWSGFGPQKRHAEINCKHEWVLNLDADEVVSQELAKQIRAVLANGKPAYSGYRFKQITVYPGQEKPRLWADFHHYIRLYDRTKIRFANSASHDAVQPGQHKTGILSGHALHFSWRSLAHLAAKYDSYTNLQVSTLRPKALIYLLLRRVTEFPLVFLKQYILHRHVTGGRHGIKVAAIIARARWRRIGKMLDQK